jgi:hypothetical protein
MAVSGKTRDPRWWHRGYRCRPGEPYTHVLDCSPAGVLSPADRLYLV